MSSPSRPVTRDDFVKAMGREPENDDLERCNCPQAGQLLHWYCGWSTTSDRPMFLCPEEVLARHVTIGR